MSNDSTETTTGGIGAIAPLGDIHNVTVHPLVLLSAADHYNRVARGTRKRVVGVLLGTVNRGQVDATNSFAVPFEEDNKNPVSFPLKWFVCAAAVVVVVFVGVLVLVSSCALDCLRMILLSFDCCSGPFCS